jgi:hypothetical protein
MISGEVGLFGERKDRFSCLHTPNLTLRHREKQTSVFRFFGRFFSCLHTHLGPRSASSSYHVVKESGTVPDLFVLLQSGLKRLAFDFSHPQVAI